MENIIFATASELAGAIREKQVSAVEVVDAHLDHIGQHNPALNAIVTLDEEKARQRAQEADAALGRGETWGPLHGVPFTIKDSLETAGMRTTSGFPDLADYVPATDATAVARLKGAGGILLGKTNLPPLAGDYQANNPIFGLTNNPWDAARTPGGSSGGEAAAIAAGLSPLGIGSDVGGSIRVPAHFCGVYGLKPTEHRVSLAGHIPEPPGAPKGLRHMAVVGPLARSVADLEMALRVIAGPDGREWEVPPASLEPAPQQNLKELRVAWSDDFGGVPVSAEIGDALANLAQELEDLGCRVEKHNPDHFDFTTVWETYGELFEAEVGSTMPPEADEQQAAMMGATPEAEVPIWRGAGRALHASMRFYTATLTQRDGLIAALEQFLQTWDVWLCPVSTTPAFTHRPPSTPLSVDGTEVDYWMGNACYTIPFNMTGNPVVVVPLAQTSAGLPIGVQVVGRRWGEMRLLAAAAQLAEVTGAFKRPLENE